jgi:hypothetical protein
MEFGENTVQLQTPGRNQRGRDGKNESLGAETVANKPRDRRPKNENKTSNLETNKSTLDANGTIFPLKKPTRL